MAAGQRIGRRGRKNHAGLLSYYRERGRPMKGYKHLTAHDRKQNGKMRKEGATMRQIGAALHVSAPPVCRELKRGNTPT